MPLPKREGWKNDGKPQQTDNVDAKTQEIKSQMPSTAPTAPTMQNTTKRGFVALIYGDTGAGKTYLSMTFPPPIYVIDTENRAVNTWKGDFKDKEINIIEPMVLRMDLENTNGTLEDIFDETASLNAVTAALTDYVKKVREKKIVGGTIIIDSVTDIWSWVQEWTIARLATMTYKESKTGEVKQRADADTQQIMQQFDWKIANKKHESIIFALRALITEGIFVVFTAREKAVPEYVNKGVAAQTRDKVRCNKELPSRCDLVIYLTKRGGEYLAYFDKFGAKSTAIPPIKEITFDKIMELDPLPFLVSK